MSVISSGTTLTTALVQTGDTNGNLVFKTGASGTTALTLGSDQSATFAGAVSFSGGAFAAGSAGAPSITFTGDTNTGIFSPAADTIAFTEGGVESMRIDSSGNVGIGTSSPGVKLDVAGAIRSIVSGGTPIVYLNNGTTQHSISNSSGAMPFNIDGTERMRIDSAGNVGIGTSSPTAGGKLDVNGTAYFGTGDKVKIYSNNILQNAGTLDIGTIGSAACIFNTANTERMRIDSSGNLLVGTTAKLQDDNKFVVQGSGGNGGNGIGIFYNTGIDSSPSLVCSKGSTTTSSSARFIQFYAGGVTTTAMGGIVGNGASNVQFASLSDAREKTNIQSISGSLEKINALNPVEFDWITDGSHIKAGFVAQEVEQVFPEFVVDNMSNDGQEVRKGLTGGMTGGIVAHLVKAIQELKTEVDALKSRIETLESK
jgi:hypothetical protein